MQKKLVCSKIQQQKFPLEPLEVYWPVCLQKLHKEHSMQMHECIKVFILEAC